MSQLTDSLIQFLKLTWQIFFPVPVYHASLSGYHDKMDPVFVQYLKRIVCWKRKKTPESPPSCVSPSCSYKCLMLLTVATPNVCFPPPPSSTLWHQQGSYNWAPFWHLATRVTPDHMLKAQSHKITLPPSICQSEAVGPLVTQNFSFTWLQIGGFHAPPPSWIWLIGTIHGTQELLDYVYQLLKDVIKGPDEQANTQGHQEPSQSPLTRTKMLLLLSSLRSLKGFKLYCQEQVRDPIYIFDYLSQIPIKWISLYCKNLYFLNEDTSLSSKQKMQCVCIGASSLQKKKERIFLYISKIKIY